MRVKTSYEKLISATNKLMKGPDRMPKVRNFDISFRNKLMTSPYQVATPPVSFRSFQLS